MDHLNENSSRVTTTDQSEDQQMLHVNNGIRQLQEPQPKEKSPAQHHERGSKATDMAMPFNDNAIEDLPRLPTLPTDQVKWNEMLYKLCLYKSRNGNEANVVRLDNDIKAKSLSDNSDLADWLQHQRKQYRLYLDSRATEMNLERIEILEAVGVKWKYRNDAVWETQFLNLQAYKKSNGDTLVPRRWMGNKTLGEWVTDQRRQYKNKLAKKPNSMTNEREQKLNEVCFTWMMRNRVGWDLRYQELAEYNEIHGHCMVPQHYEENRALGKWVSKQREQYRLFLQGKASIMKQSKIDKLNSEGFCWSVKGRAAQEMNNHEIQQPVAGVQILKNDNALTASTDPNTTTTVALTASTDPDTIIV
jgi:hypothetical protein